MANVFDVAKYILHSFGEMTAMKLQKLVYYSQAWNLVWEENELFSEDFEAWANGAVCRPLYNVHRGRFKMTESDMPRGDIGKLTNEEKENIDKVLASYGKYTAQQLSDINHQELPWIEARGDLPPMANCNTVITKAAMFEYHSGIWDG